ncbi:C40 family peptidase, partial [Neisseria sp. P0001.S005]
MNFLLRLAAVWTSVAMLASVNFSYADDLENLITTRQRVLNQFNDNANVYGNTRQATPVHPTNTYPAPSNNTRASSGNADELIGSAMGLLGVAYRYGGTSA